MQDFEENNPKEPVYDPSKHRLAIRLQSASLKPDAFPVFSSWEAKTHNEVLIEFDKLAPAFGIIPRGPYWDRGIAVGYVPEKYPHAISHSNTEGGEFTQLNREVR